MKISDVRDLLKDKRVSEEINRHLWIESQKAGYSIGIERATDEWLRLYAEGWMKYHMPRKYSSLQAKKRKQNHRQKKKKAAQRAQKKTPSRKKTSVKRKPAKKKPAKKTGSKTVKKKTKKK